MKWWAIGEKSSQEVLGQYRLQEMTKVSLKEREAVLRKDAELQERCWRQVQLEEKLCGWRYEELYIEMQETISCKMSHKWEVRRDNGSWEMIAGEVEMK